MPTEEEKVTRKLRAILSADVKGYSLLMANDEAFTIKTLKEYRSLMSEQIQGHSGRVVDTPGDNLLAEFSSAVDAVECAVEIQKRLKMESDQCEEDKKLKFRIGVNIGDVVQDDNRIYGSGVNVAARIEGLADPGGVCISRNVYDQIKDKMNFGYEYLGNHEVKNIKEPVRVYKLLMADEDAGKLIGDVPKRVTKKWVLATVVLALIMITSIVWQVYQKMTEPGFEPAKIEKMAYPLPEKPSIAVLPFNNLSDNPAQDYIAVGITENIISALSNISGMFIIASESTSTYRGKHVKIHQVSEDLGVRYVLEGSVQKSGKRVRVNAQLIDATSGHYLWSEKFDSELQDLFSLQDEITHNIIVELQVQLTEGEQARVSHKKTTSMEAWSYANKGLAIWMRTSKENNAKAMELFKQAVELDPNYVWAWVRLAWTHSMAALHPEWSQNPSEHLKMFFEISKKVLAMDESDSDVHALSGLAYLWEKEHEKAIAEGEKALVLGPTNAQAHVLLACSMTEVGRFDDVIRLVGRAMRLHPYYPAYYLTWIGGAYRMTGRYEEALTVYNQLLKRSRKGEYSDIDAHIYLVDLYAEMGKTDEARAHAAEIFKIEPGFSLKRIRSINTYDYTDPALLERRLKALRKAGIPDKPPLPLPDKPSIAVLPFDNLSADPEQEYFSDGITEDIITDLSKIKNLLVISRNSTFTYKGKDVRIPEVAKELNVRYVLEGSVRRVGDQVRINAQLIDAKTDHHIWANRYDGVMNDIFALQDEITRKIISALALKLTVNEKKFLVDKGTENLQAYDAFLKGWQGYRLLTKEGFTVAKTYLEKAVELDPEFARAYAALAILYWKAIKYASPELRQGLGLNNRAAKSAVQAKPQLLLKKSMKKPTALAHGLTSQLYLFRYQHDEALAEIEQAIAMDPNNPEFYTWMSEILWLMGKNREAIESAEMALRLDPNNPAIYLRQLGRSYLPGGDLEKSLQVLERANRLNPELSGTVAFHQSIIYGIQGRNEEARTAYQIFLKNRLNPVRNVNDLLLYLQFSDPKKLVPIAEALIKAGAPGSPTDYYKILKENRVAGEDIRSRFFDRKIVGIAMSTGKPVQWTFQKSGEFQFKMGDLQDKGISWIEEDVILFQYNKLYGGLPFGATLYKNPEGSTESKNQYFIVSDIGSITPVALVEK